MGWLALATVVGLSLHAPVAEAQPELTRAFAFGSRLLSCPTYNDPGTSYTIVYQGTAADLEYSAARGWGYDVVDPGATGYARLGPFDDTANSRDAFEDSCPEEIYDSFIGAKEFSAPCANDPAPSDDPCLPPEGIIFRVDLPNGLYRFAAAAGEAQNLHTSRILVEDGGAGPPEDIGPNHVVLVNNHDQAVHGAGVFARVGFDGFIPPPASGPGFVNMDENGLATGGEPSSPTLQVTQGYLRLHQLKGRTIGTDPNGGDMVIFEIWRVSDSFHAVSWGSTWKYRLGTEEASSPDTTAWSTISFDDSGWGEGPAPFGYGDPPYGTDISLLDPPMSNNFTSIFLRHRFELADPSAINQLDAHVDFDDGFVVWINGVEVLAVNVPSDRPIAFDA
ncbi:MAG: hypothetical protein JXA90_07530, partial [Planctomycetes bacterium]|nr:hypothetical protein [Planctomycetota bacterium]